MTAELQALKAAAQQRIAAGQLELSLGLEPADGGPLPITSSRMGRLLDALGHAYRVLGLEDAAGGDDVFRHLVLARIIEPVSKLEPWPAGPNSKRRDRRIYYQYKADRNPPDAPRNRRAGRQGRQSRRRSGSGQAEPVHRPRRRREKRQPRPRSESP